MKDTGVYLNNKRLEVPIIQGGMGVGVSMSGLAGAVAANGGMGVISSVNIGFREPDFAANPLEANLRALRSEIAKARERSGGHGLIAVNVMTAVSHYAETCRCAAEAGADAIISGAGLPMELPACVAGTKTMIAPVISSGRAARLLKKHYQRHYDRLPDFFVIEGSRAGGHLGFAREELLSGTTKTNEEILAEVLPEAGDIPVFVAGGVYDGRDMARFVKLGAKGVQMATRFIATTECDASERFKQAIVDTKAGDIRIIESPVGMPARAIYSPLLQKLEQGEQFPALRCNGCLTGCRKDRSIPYCISRALIEAVCGNWDEGLFFTGSNADRVDRIVPVAELMEEIRKEFQEDMT